MLIFKLTNLNNRYKVFRVVIINYNSPFYKSNKLNKKFHSTFNNTNIQYVPK